MKYLIFTVMTGGPNPKKERGRPIGSVGNNERTSDVELVMTAAPHRATDPVERRQELAQLEAEIDQLRRTTPTVHDIEAEITTRKRSIR